MARLSRWARAKSFADAGRGVALLLASQANARIHLAASVLALALGAWLGLTAAEWCWIVLAIAQVWVAEGLNTALEGLADAVRPHHDPQIGRAKDIAAAAVLLAAAASVAIAALVFGPRLLALWRS